MTHPPTDLTPERPSAVPATGDALRLVLRGVPSPVAIVTTRTDAGPRGATIGSFTSVSLDPPLVSFNVTHETALHEALAAGQTWGVHLLAADQAALADHFARSDLDGARQLATVDHLDGSPPLLRGALAVLICEPHAQVEAGDHTIHIGRVLSVVDGASTEPLLYYRQSYRGIGDALDAD